MADIAVDVTKMGVVFPHKADIIDVTLTEAVTALQTLYQLTTGKFGLCDANVAGKEQFRGVALKAGAANQVVPMLKMGHVFGYAVSALSGDVAVFQSDTAGSLADVASVTKTVRCGRVIVLTDSGLTKVAYIAADWITVW